MAGEILLRIPEELQGLATAGGRVRAKRNTRRNRCRPRLWRAGVARAACTPWSVASASLPMATCANHNEESHLSTTLSPRATGLNEDGGMGPVGPLFHDRSAIAM
eukprot:scaffold12886_cov107-Isochrysis_galbana.AAC.1